MKTKIIATVGLPASGKTTWAGEQVRAGGGKVVRVNRDDLRASLFPGVSHSQKRERIVLMARDAQIRAFLGAGLTVISDDTNLSPKNIEAFRKMANEVEIKDFTSVPLHECLRRDRRRGEDAVGDKVIRDMYFRYLKPKHAKRAYDPDLPMALICDLDGTLSLVTNRNPYDCQLAGQDLVCETVLDIVKMYHRRDWRILLVSARDEGLGREVTEKWLADNIIPYDMLWMRKAGDSRPDTIVKREIYDTFIRDKYNVGLVLDDRTSVVDMWRDELGLKCFQVESGDF